jgi:hypothetical protein
MCMCIYLVTSVPCPVAWVRAGRVGTSGHIGPSQRGVVRPPGGGQVGGHAGGQGVGLTPYTNLNPYDPL